ncbi:MAG: N-acetyl-gamma-glutamyl-phosphate reductase [Coriobacteriaceae bacterium]|nr:N-acetyl-gamma-glutamyl-phosphate reductase [Coriobacteriaceae bacterium]
MKKAAVIGAAGYAGVEAVRLLLAHPDFELTCITSDHDVGKPLAELYPALQGSCDLVFEPHDVTAVAAAAEVAFLTVPHTASLEMTPQLLEAGLVVIDLSADYRLKDQSVYEHWYSAAHTSADLLEEAVYGLPELYRADLQTAPRLVACPGCYPTASALAAVPALEAGVALETPLVVAALSGVSGAGRTASEKTHFCTADESAGIYGLPHRHTPEIAQTFSAAAGRGVEVVFTPHLVPMKRGLVSTVYLPLKPDISSEEISALYSERYASEPFVTLLPQGQLPQTSWVVGSNRAQVGLAFDEASNTLIASCAIDNLIKGAAGQAVQAANLVCGFAETAGLDAVVPVV